MANRFHRTLKKIISVEIIFTQNTKYNLDFILFGAVRFHPALFASERNVTCKPYTGYNSLSSVASKTCCDTKSSS